MLFLIEEFVIFYMLQKVSCAMPIINPEFVVTKITPDASGEISIGDVSFPVMDSNPRSVSSFGHSQGKGSFVKSTYQSVTSSTATIDSETTIVGVNFQGPVLLTLPDTTNFQETAPRWNTNRLCVKLERK